MPDRVTPGDNGRQLEIANFTKALNVEGGSKATLRVPAVEQRQLVLQNMACIVSRRAV